MTCSVFDVNVPPTFDAEITRWHILPNTLSCKNEIYNNH